MASWQIHRFGTVDGHRGESRLTGGPSPPRAAPASASRSPAASPRTTAGDFGSASVSAQLASRLSPTRRAVAITQTTVAEPRAASQTDPAGRWEARRLRAPHHGEDPIVRKGRAGIGERQECPIQFHPCNRPSPRPPGFTAQTALAGDNSPHRVTQPTRSRQRRPPDALCVRGPLFSGGLFRRAYAFLVSVVAALWSGVEWCQEALGLNGSVSGGESNSGWLTAF